MTKASFSSLKELQSKDPEYKWKIVYASFMFPTQKKIWWVFSSIEPDEFYNDSINLSTRMDIICELINTEKLEANNIRLFDLQTSSYYPNIRSGEFAFEEQLDFETSEEYERVIGCPKLVQNVFKDLIGKKIQNKVTKLTVKNTENLLFLLKKRT